MALKLRRGTDAQRQSITPEEGELIYTTDNKEVFVGDGITTGGVLVTGGGGGGGISNIIEDTSPQLGGNLDTNGFNISGAGTVTASHFYGTGTSGNVAISSVDGATLSGNILINAVNTSIAGQEGGDININAGIGNTTGTGGDIIINGGGGGSSGAQGGSISLTGGPGTVSSAGGFIQLSGGNSLNGIGGNLFLRGGSGGGGNGNVYLGNIDTTEIQIGSGSNQVHLNADVTLSGNIIPDTDGIYDLGSSVYKFRDLYLSGTSLWIGDARITNNGSSAVNIPSGSTIGGVPLGPSGSLYIGGPLQADLVLNGYEITGQGNIFIGGYISATDIYGNLVGSDSTVLVDFNLNRVNADINRTGTLTITSSGNIEFSSTNITFPIGAAISNLDISQLSDTGGLLTSVGGQLISHLSLNNFNITGVGGINIIGIVEASAVKCNVQGATTPRVIVDAFNYKIDADIYKNDTVVINSPTSIDLSAPEINIAPGSTTLFHVAADDSTLIPIRNDNSIKFLGDTSINTSSNSNGDITVSLSNTLDTSDSSDFEFIPGVVMRSNLSVENNLTVTGSITAGSFISTQTGTPEVYSETNIDLTAGNRVSVTTSPFRLAQFTTTERNNITAQNGDLIYNTTVNKLQGYQNGSWINIDDGTAA